MTVSGLSSDSIIFTGSILQFKQDVRANSTLNIFEIVSFWRKLHTIFYSGCVILLLFFYISSTSVVHKGSSLSTSSPAHTNHHLNSEEMASLCGFDLHNPND